MWYRSDFSSDLVLTGPTASDAKTLGYALSLEGGQRFSLDENWSLTPQAQLLWSSVRGSQFQDQYQNVILTSQNNSLTARMGVSANYSTSRIETDKTSTRMQLGGVVNVYQDIKHGADYVTVADTSIGTGTLDPTWGEVGASGSYSWRDGKYTVLGKLTTVTGVNHFGKDRSISANLGFQVKW